jgi:hypothetical protein
MCQCTVLACGYDSFRTQHNELMMYGYTHTHARIGVAVWRTMATTNLHTATHAHTFYDPRVCANGWFLAGVPRFRYYANIHNPGILVRVGQTVIVSQCRPPVAGFTILRRKPGLPVCVCLFYSHSTSDSLVSVVCHYLPVFYTKISKYTSFGRTRVEINSCTLMCRVCSRLIVLCR